MKRFLLVLFSFTIGLVLCTFFPQIKKEEALANNTTSFYSEKNVPMFYGAIEITIDKNVVSNFDLKDARFRILAKDFEDGDLSSKIACTFNNVCPTQAGDYKVDYEVKDSHNNVAKISVPVHVLDKSEGESVIVRRIYAIPSLWNLKLVGTERCNEGDSQTLGVFLPAGTSVETKVISTNCPDLKITHFTNTRAKNAFSSIKGNGKDYQTIKNTKDTTGYDSVPLVTSPRLTGNEIDKTFDIEVKFDSSVKALDYYHYKDSESAFKDKWKASENAFGVVDGEAIMVVVPFDDIDKISGYTALGNPFDSLDAFFEYYLEVVNRMDAMIGLSLNPTNSLDQNYRTKYLAVADAGMSGAGAYYLGTFIAVCSTTASALFQYGWGTLHEIAHGYQGYLGKGGTNAQNSIYLNETGNNILAHYIQMSSIYKKSDRYIGALENCEESINTTRKNAIASGKTIFNNDSGTYTNTREKLYCIVNLLDSFEGEKTYGKLFQYYRRIANEFGTEKYSVPEVYVKFFAEEYKANILPYLKAWAMSISNDVEREIANSNLKTYSITADSLTPESFEKIYAAENMHLKYGLTSDDVFEKYGLTSSLKFSIEIDNFDLIKNKNIALAKNGEILQIKKITTNEICFNNVNTGTYEIKLPTVFGYSNLACILTLKEGENLRSYSYVKNEYGDFAKPTTIIKIKGINGTLGFSLTFDEGYASGKVVYGAADLGNQSTDVNELFISVEIKNASGETLHKVDIKGKEYFSKKTQENMEPSFTIGSKICIYTQRPKLVGVYLKENDEKIDAYSVTDNNIEYEITADGLKLLNKENFDTKNVLYEAIKSNTKKRIDNVKNNITEREIENKIWQIEEKSYILNAYSYLRDEDKEEYREFIEKINKGGKPTISLKRENVEINVGDKLDLYLLIEITDAEDFIIESNKENVNIESEFNAKIPNIYSVKYTVTDSDGNTAEKEISIKVVAIQKPENKAEFQLIYLLPIPLVLVIFSIIYLIATRKKHKKYQD